MKKRLSYFYWQCHWDFERAIAALAKQYEVEYREGDKEMLATVIRRAFLHYNGISLSSSEVRDTSIRDALEELEVHDVVPWCVMKEVYEYSCIKKLPDFHPADLMAPPPYTCNWEKPREVEVGVLQKPAYAA